VRSRLTRLATLVAIVVTAAACGDYVGDDVRAGDYPRRDALVFGDVDTVAGGNATLSADDEPAEPQPVDPFTLEVGTCFDDLDDPPLRAFELGRDVGLLPCSEPHRFELYDRIDLAEPPGESWPGEAEVGERATMACFEAFEDFIGTPWEESGLDFVALPPTRTRWDAGDARASCAVFDLGLVPLVGTMASSGL
jgi:hypothetical protein